MVEDKYRLGNLKALLFDLDGTLIEPSIDFAQMRRAVIALADKYGFQSPDLERMYVLEIVRYVQAHLEDAGQRFAQEAEEAIEAIELEAAERVAAYPGVLQLLEGLRRRGFGVAIVTRNCRRAVLSILQRIPLAHDVLLTRDDIEHVKPDPRHLLAALQRLRVAGEESAMCGDHPMDILAGKQVHARTVGVLQAGSPRDYFDAVAPDLVLERVTDLCYYL
ncbi:MAG: HAD-IA family hydrolase [Chloroflexi bacterium]|nr:HAD-IA family hydrolase [Chloroflexota bacterium]